MKPRSACVQAAVVAIYEGRLCLITNRSGRRLVLPKGSVRRREAITAAAAREAWEEAGILGVVSETPVDVISVRTRTRKLRVSIFRMQVVTVEQRWPESRLRDRLWFSHEDVHQARIPECYLPIVQTMLAQEAARSAG